MRGETDRLGEDGPVGRTRTDRSNRSLAQVSTLEPPGARPQANPICRADSHTCEHLLLGIKLPPASIFPDRSAPIPWSDPALARFKRGMDGDVVVSEVRETSRKPDEVYGLLERWVCWLDFLDGDGAEEEELLIRCYEFGNTGSFHLGASWVSRRAARKDCAEANNLTLSLEIFGRKHNTRPG